MILVHNQKKIETQVTPGRSNYTVRVTLGGTMTTPKTKKNCRTNAAHLREPIVTTGAIAAGLKVGGFSAL